MGVGLKEQAGFTLIELVIVIVVLGILGAVAMIRFGTITQSAKDASLKGMAGAYGSQLAIAINTIKTLPTGGATSGVCGTSVKFIDCVYSRVPNPTPTGFSRSTYNTGNNRFNICTGKTTCSNAIPAATCGSTADRYVTVTYVPATGAMTIAAPGSCSS